MIRTPYTAVDSSELNKLLKNWLFLFTLATAVLLLQSQLLFAQDPSSTVQQAEATTHGYHLALYNPNLEVGGLEGGSYSFRLLNISDLLKEDPNRPTDIMSTGKDSADGNYDDPAGSTAGSAANEEPPGARGGDGRKNAVELNPTPGQAGLKNAGDGTVGLAQDDFILSLEATTVGYSSPGSEQTNSLIPDGSNAANDLSLLGSLSNRRDNAYTEARNDVSGQETGDVVDLYGGGNDDVLDFGGDK